MYIKVNGVMINFDRVCLIKQAGATVVLYFDYSEGAQYTSRYNTENDAKAAYKALETLLLGKG